MIMESDGMVIVMPPPVKCSRCAAPEGSVGIIHNEYYEGGTLQSRRVYYEIFYKCVACNYKIRNMTRDELNVVNSYPPDKQVWPKAVFHEYYGRRVK